jgi:DNA polymerase-3 subunit gamma/tau
MARILAKAVNCENRHDAEPCDRCPLCDEIRAGRALDVIEIDGASNRRIDDVRDLRQKVSMVPSRARKKVYIIDEVHMLTKEAFNALLKTLEEPPENVIFIFATTEPHKVPLTILSRCQRFDFRPISRGEIAGFLRRVAQQEELPLPDDASFAIARKANGSLRDALSLFDQIRAFAGGQFDVRDVFAVAGMIEDEVYISLLRKIASGSGGDVISLLDEVERSGADLLEFYDGLLEHLRNLLVLKEDDSLASTCDVSESSLREYRDLAPLFTVEELLRMFELLAGNRELLRNSELKRIMCETIYLRLTAARRGKTAAAPSPPDPQSGAATKRAASETKTPETAKQKTEEKVKRAPRGAGTGEVWKSFLEMISARKATLFGVLSRVEPLSMEGELFSCSAGSENSFMKEQLKLPEHLRIMDECLSQVAGRKMQISIRFEEGRPQEKRKMTGGAPLIDSMKRIFDVEEIDTRRPPGDV